MQTTTNYGLKIYEGTDLFNPLTVENINTSDLDTIVKGVSNAGVGTATELLTATVHVLTRSDTARNVFYFTATANYEAGETFEVDGVQVTAKTPDGQNLSTGAYVINSSVLCILNGTLLTVIVNPAKALDADKLDGHDSTYFATAGDLSVLDNQVGAISNKVGTGVLDVGNDCVDGINTLNTHITNEDTDTITRAESNNHFVSDVTFYRKGDIVTFKMVGVTQILDQQEVSLGTLKEGMRPPRNVSFSEEDPNASNTKVIITIKTTGEVTIFAYGGGAAITHNLVNTNMYQV